MRIFPELTLAAMVAGVGLALWSEVTLHSSWPLLMLALAGCAVAVGLRALRLPAGPVILAAALFLGFWRGHTGAPLELPIVPGGPASDIVLLITDAPVPVRSGYRFSARVLPADGGPPEADGSIPDGANLLVYGLPPPDLVYQRSPPYLRHGDTLLVSGRVEHPEPIGDFDYAAWLASRRISAVMWVQESEFLGAARIARPIAVLHSVRSRLAGALQRGISAPQSALAQALLLGIRGELPEAVKDSFRTAGMAHLLAISGLHVGIVMALSLAAASAAVGRGTPLTVALAALTVWTYAALSGFDPPVVRASIMGSLALTQIMLGRGMRGVTALLLAAAAMVGAQPAILGSLSFQLSFTAMAGVLVALPLITVLSGTIGGSLAAQGSATARWFGYGLTLLIASAVISTFTTVATVPLVAMHFGSIPLMSVPATILAMPAMPLALVGSAATASIGQLAASMAVAVGTLTWGPLAWLIWVADAMPAVLIPAPWLTPPVAIAWYVGLGMLVALLSAPRVRRAATAWRRGPTWRPSGLTRLLVALAPVAALTVLLFAFQLFGSRADGRLHVYVLDIGQGDAILVVTPDGRQMLVDGGPDPTVILAALGSRLPAGDRQLDVVAATHLDSDHAGGLIGVLDRYDANVVLQSADTPDSVLHPQWRSVLDRRDHSVVTVEQGHRIRLGDHVVLEVLYPPPDGLPAGVEKSANNLSTVMRLTYGEVSFLLTGDVEQDAERFLVGTRGPSLQSDVLKVGHHGSRSSTSSGFVRSVAPESAVISAGRENRYGHPSPDVIQRLEEEVDPDKIFLTARDGTVEFISDGTALWVKTEFSTDR